MSRRHRMLLVRVLLSESCAAGLSELECSSIAGYFAVVAAATLHEYSL